MALRQGWTEEELTEVLLHLSGYIGVPIIRESMLVASQGLQGIPRRGRRGQSLTGGGDDRRLVRSTAARIRSTPTRSR